jgi:type I restriction enzyme S subunit
MVADLAIDRLPFRSLLAEIVDNRGRSCPTSDDGIALIATNCIHNDQLYPTYEKVRWVSPETYSTWFRGHPKPGDIIFVNKGTPGRVCLVPDPVDFCIAQDMVAVRADPGLIDPLYLFALLRSPTVQKQIANMYVGTLIPHFKKGDFDRLLLPVIRDRGAQEEIGRIHFEFCQKIELNRRMNETLEAMAQALFKSWFVDFDPVLDKALAAGNPIPDAFADRAAQRAAYLSGNLPSPSGRGAGGEGDYLSLFPDRFQDSPLGPIPEGWEVGTLGKLLEIHDKKRIPLNKRQRQERQGPYPYYGAADVMDHVDEFLFDGVYILAGEDGSVVTEAGHPVLQYVWGRFWVNNHAHVLRGRRGVSCEQLLLFLQQCDIAPFVTGAVQPKLNQENLRSVPLVLPPQAVSEAFGLLVAPSFAARRTNVDESKVLERIRDTLLPELLGGKSGLSWT